MEKKEPLYTVGGNVNWCSHCGKHYGSFLKTKNGTTMWPSNSIPGYISEKTKILIQKDTRTAKFSSVQFSSLAQLCQLLATPRTAAWQTSLSITNSRSLLKFMSIVLVMPSEHLILMSSPSPPAFNISQHRGLFQWVSSSHYVAKVLEFQLWHQSSQWIIRIISFRMDWLDLLAVQGTLKVFFNTVVQKHQFFSTQLSLLSNFNIKTWLLEKW